MIQIHTEIINTYTYPLIFIPGTPEDGFAMGDEHNDLWEACRPVHQVRVSDFYIGQYLVTQAIWEAVMKDNPSFFKGTRRPVECVYWDDIQVFIEQLNALTKESRLHECQYRLPTEAEWEYAALGGPYARAGERYAGSDDLKEVGWYKENSHGETKPVGLKSPNALGLYDMSGNVWEWCEDDWHRNYEGAPADGSAWIDTRKRDSFRVFRGGSWGNTAGNCRSAFRYYWGAGHSGRHLGFRLVLAPQSVG